MLEKKKGRVVYLDCRECTKDILGISWVLSELIWSLLNLVTTFWPDFSFSACPLCVTWSSYTLGKRPGATIMYGLRQHNLVYDQLYWEIYTESSVLHVEIFAYCFRVILNLSLMCFTLLIDTLNVGDCMSKPSTIKYA